MNDLLSAFGLFSYVQKRPDGKSVWISLNSYGYTSEKSSIITHISYGASGTEFKEMEIWALRSGVYVFLTHQPWKSHDDNMVYKGSSGTISWYHSDAS